MTCPRLLLSRAQSHLLGPALPDAADAPPVSPINEAFFFRVARGAFALRRKTLLNSLGSALGSTYSKEALRDAIAACGLPPDIRGERLSLQEMAALSDRLYQSGDR